MVVGANGKASYSADGITWTALTAGDATGIKFGTTAFARSVYYGDGKFIVGGANGKASYSADGIDWTVLTAGEDTGIKFGVNTSAYSFVYGNSKFVAVGGYGRTSYSTYTPDTPDSNAPTISNVSSTPSSSSATLTWSTNEDSSSEVEYGLSATYGTATAETDTATRVTNHQVSLNNLKTCAKYYFRVKSKDATGNQGVSSQSTFFTTGCVVAAPILDGNSGVVSNSSGGSVALNTEEGTVTLFAPINFYPEDLTLQINKLDSNNVPTAPSGLNLIGDNFFDLSTILDNGTEVSYFNQPLTFTVAYGSNLGTTYDENSLDVYKYSNGVWEEKNCTVDTTAHTLTCALSSFSTYGIFGEEASKSLYPPVIALGNNRIIQLSRTETASLQRSKFILRGRALDLTRGTIVQILRNGSVVARKRILSNKRWRYEVTQKQNTTATYQLRYLDKNTNEEIRVYSEYRILVDKNKPNFQNFPKSATMSREGFISWTATDDDQIKYYQIKFQGRIINTNESRFQIPQTARRGVSRLIVIAFDRAENSSARKILVRIR